MEDGMTDTGAYVQSLAVMHPLVEPVTRAAIRALQLPAGSRGLDAGCGIGLEAMLLAEAVGPAGRITGLDLSPEHLACAREIAASAGLAARISFQEGDLRGLPFDDDAFDWAWAKDAVAEAPQLGLEALATVKELARVVRPGGAVAILAWSSQVLLPGFPLLEARLNATSSGIAPFTGAGRPESHFLRALGWLRAAGLKQLSARTFAGDAHAPLSDEHRRALVELYRERWAGAEPELTPEDRAEYRRLCLPESPDFILNQPDYYAFWTYSMFRGVVAT
jgi:ubiquinone/menaquinone biosynthesis C-methylase UbiE